jgi:hypothetical protein
MDRHPAGRLEVRTVGRPFRGLPVHRVLATDPLARSRDDWKVAPSASDAPPRVRGQMAVADFTRDTTQGPYRTGRHASRAAISAAVGSGRRYDPQRNLTSDPGTGYRSEALVRMELASRPSICRSKLLFLDAPRAAHRRPSTRAHASVSIRRSLRPGPDTWRPQLPVGPMLEGLTGPRAGLNASNGSPASNSSRPKWAKT